jgi:hypothetical protein
MQVGDLVKIYNYTEKAREQSRLLGGRDAIDCLRHRYGLIIAGADCNKYGHYREVLRSCDGEAGFYNVTCLEVINESR